MGWKDNFKYASCHEWYRDSGLKTEEEEDECDRIESKIHGSTVRKLDRN